ncbi:TolC family protein [Formosa algae]|uniref:TolC family protein n=1 Tax=Formosa algae TaxID=225843 RepID=UPI000CCDC784|nr:TolC family protein [Formosa algae]PNW25911.1 transporter [Formosa algae]
MITHQKYSVILGVCLLTFVSTIHPVYAQDLTDLIHMGLKQNPNVINADLHYQLATEQVHEAHVIPNTDISLGYFVSEPETRTGPQKFKASVTQMLPWFGTVTARENYATSLAEAQYENIAISQRKLVLSISQNYYQLWAITEKQQVLQEQYAILKRFETLALASVGVGKASAVDVLKLQMRQNEIEAQKQLLEQDYLGVQTKINSDLNRHTSESITVTSTLEIPTENILQVEKVTPVHPELLQYDKLYASVEQSELLNQKNSAPMLGFGLDYIAIAERQDETLVDNGKDVIMPMFTVSIPIFNTSYASKTKQHELQKDIYKTQKTEKMNGLISVLDVAVKQRKSARISYETQIKNINQAKHAQDILMKSYETGSIDFDAVLEIQDLQLTYEIRAIEATMAYYNQQTLINYITQ